MDDWDRHDDRNGYDDIVMAICGDLLKNTLESPEMDHIIPQHTDYSRWHITSG